MKPRTSSSTQAPRHPNRVPRAAELCGLQTSTFSLLLSTTIIIIYYYYSIIIVFLIFDLVVREGSCQHRQAALIARPQMCTPKLLAPPSCVPWSCWWGVISLPGPSCQTVASSTDAPAGGGVSLPAVIVSEFSGVSSVCLHLETVNGQIFWKWIRTYDAWWLRLWGFLLFPPAHPSQFTLDVSTAQILRCKFRDP